jgi:tetratricopeptide (TPR) repeat protein
VIWQETDGNPFFTRQMIRHVLETATVSDAVPGHELSGIQPDHLELPSSVREVVLARVARLAEPAVDMLTTAAVVGREFDLDLLSAATQQSVDHLLQLLGVCDEAGLVSEGDGSGQSFRFTHALIQRTLYAELGGARRAMLHGRVAEALEDLCVARPRARSTERARHWSLAPQPACAEQALIALQRAADVSLAELAPEAALQFAEWALALAQDPGTPSAVTSASRLTDLKITLGSAQSQTGSAEYRTTLLEAAQNAAARDDLEQVARAALACDRGFFSVAGSVDEMKVDLLELALDRLPAGHPTRPLLLANLCQELTYSGSLARRRALAEEALTLARSAGDDATVIRVSNYVFDALRLPSELADTLERTDDALSRARRLDEPLLEFWATVCRHEAAANAGDIPELDHCLAEARRLAHRLDQPTIHWVHTYHRANRAMLRGATDETEELAAAALELGQESGQPDAATIYAGQMFHVFWQRGIAPDGIGIVEAFAAENPEMAFTQAALAVCHAEGERFDDSLAVLDKVVGSGFDFSLDLFWCTAICGLAEAAVMCDSAEHATVFRGLLLPYADQFCATGATSEGPITRYLGGLAAVMGNYDEAAAHFSAAAASCRRAGARFHGTRNKLWWGAMLLKRRAEGDDQRAVDLFQSAHRTAVESNYPDLVRRATLALAECQPQTSSSR